MVTLVVATEPALLIARPTSKWVVEEHLTGKSPESLAVDPQNPTRVYCGTWGNGLWRSDDAGTSWNPVGSGIVHAEITAVAVSPAEPGVVYAGTEPSAVFRCENRGETWTELRGLQSLPSARSWSFPPRPETHHVRWIEPDPTVAGRVFVAIEAGALVRTLDGGQTWLDRVDGGPIDTHAAATHQLAPGWVYSAAGDGYFESDNAGESWSRQVDGLHHRYLVGVAVDPADPNTVIVSAASGPFVAYSPRRAEAYLYRKLGRRRFELAMVGLPDGQGTIASRLATNPDEPGVIYAANNYGLFRSPDAGQSWKRVEIPWSQHAFAHGVEALICLPD
ncbi:MAG: glycosyl hydrolase [Chloroflexota bacterium]|nr:MAG: glycosyl hydrolase [Chloroflexota bacterium]